jgi:hypothetical protein
MTEGPLGEPDRGRIRELVRAQVVDPRTHRAGQVPGAQAFAGFEGTTTSPAMICARRSSICGRMSSMNPPL